MVERYEGEPRSELAEIADAAGETIPEGVRAVIMVSNDESGVALLRHYGEDTDALTDILLHARALAEANGMQLALVPLNQG